MNINMESARVKCEVCHIRPAVVFQGGTHADLRRLWHCCEECKKKILDDRIKERRQNDGNGIC